MPASLVVFWGFGSMFLWGGADLLARNSAVRIGFLSVFLFIQVIGALPPLVIGLVQVAVTGPPWDSDAWAFAAVGAPVALLMGTGYLAYYRGLEVGTVSVVTPVVSCWLVVTTLLAAVFLGEDLGIAHGLFIAVILVGILLLSVRRERSRQGLGYALVGMLAFGIAFVLWKPLTDVAGPALSVGATRLGAALSVGIFLAVRRVGVVRGGTRLAPLLVAAGVMDGLGYLTFNLGIEGAPVSIIAPVAAAHATVTLGLAWLLIGERPTPVQYVGIASAVGGSIALTALVGA